MTNIYRLFLYFILLSSLNTSAKANFIQFSTPAITSFTPETASVGSLVTITGIGLNNLTSVSIGGVSAIPISNNGNILVAMVMPGTTAGKISVITSNGTVNSASNLNIGNAQKSAIQDESKLIGLGSVGAPQQGYSISLSADGNTAIIGGINDDLGKGAAWVYIRNENTWTQQGSKLVGTGSVGITRQGTSVSLSADGNTAIVGGQYDNLNQGAVWIFTRTGNTWSQQGDKLVSSNVLYQGCSVSLSADGNTAIVGGFNAATLQGASCIFTRNNGVWMQQGEKLEGSQSVGLALQGCAVAISADATTAIVGGYYDNDSEGAAWIFTRNGNTWSQQGNKLVGTGNIGASQQGCSVALSADGNTAIVGGFTDNDDQGATWVFTRTGNTWSQQGSKLVGSGNIGSAQQGYSVALTSDGNTALIGGFNDDAGNGATWIFHRDNGIWIQQKRKLVGNGNINIAYQGYAVSLSANGNTALLGGFNDALGQGATWAYTLAPSDNANLRSLAFSAGSIEPIFDPIKTEYSLPLLNTASTITITPTVAQHDATLQIQVNGGNFTTITPDASTVLNLNIGKNIIDIKVTAQDGSTTQIYTITVTRAKADQSITFAPLDDKAIGALDFEPDATASSNLTVNYTSGDLSVATIVDGKIRIVAVGVTTITAKQGGDENYNPATDVAQTLTVHAPLPVSFISFDASLNKNGMVDLTWLTTSEKNNSHFIVLRSTNGVDFSQLAKIAGSGNSDRHNRYQIEDKNPAKGNNYYQLIQYDVEGKATVLATKLVSTNFENEDRTTIFPNPAHDVVNIKFKSGIFETVKLIDLTGKILLSNTIESVQDQISINIQDLPASSYIITLSGAKQTESRRLIKK